MAQGKKVFENRARKGDLDSEKQFPQRVTYPVRDLHISSDFKFIVCKSMLSH